MKSNIENGCKKWKMFHMEEKKKDNYYEKILEMNATHGSNLIYDWEHSKWEFFKKTSPLLAHNKIFMECR